MTQVRTPTRIQPLLVRFHTAPRRLISRSCFRVYGVLRSILSSFHSRNLVRQLGPIPRTHFDWLLLRQRWPVWLWILLYPVHVCVMYKSYKFCHSILQFSQTLFYRLLALIETLWWNWHFLRLLRCPSRSSSKPKYRMFPIYISLDVWCLTLLLSVLNSHLNFKAVWGFVSR